MKTTNIRGKMGGILGAIAMGLFANALAVAENGELINVNVNESVTVAAENADVAIANPAIANVVPFPEKNLVSVIGVKAGITTLTIIPKDDRKVSQRLVRVTDVDAEAAKKVEAEVKKANEDAAVAASKAKVELIRVMASQPELQVRTIGDTVVLDGKVETEIDAQRAVQVASTYNAKVLNLMEVKNPRQIKVVTRVAEVNTDSIKDMGFKWMGPNGEVQYALDYTGGGSILHGLVQTLSSSGQAPDDPTALDIGVDVILQMLVTQNHARLLSEPTLLTMSGQEASFLVGQEIPIIQQLPQSFTVEFKEVGVRMKVKPVADSENRINTSIHAEVSQVVGTEPRFGTPIIGTKKADTALQVKDGQTIVIGGLLENNISRDYMRKFPWLADIPIFGIFFRQKEFDQAQREVLFFMTPEVVKDANAEVAGAVRTPLMKEWNDKKSKEGLLEVPNSDDDWGLHDPKRMGIPKKEPKAESEAVAPEAAGQKPTTGATAPEAAPGAATPSK
jgi:pilus assembly protein CpaC